MSKGKGIQKQSSKPVRAQAAPVLLDALGRLTRRPSNASLVFPDAGWPIDVEGRG